MLQTLPLWLILFAISGSIHEFAHAWTARKLGDPTAEREGRLTINPLVHVDPMGLLVLAISALAGFGFGWMKPVPVGTWNLAHPKRDLMLISLAGPVSNILQAIFWLVLATLLGIRPGMGTGLPVFFSIAIGLNLILAAFNLIPLRPLDGFAVLVGLLPQRASLWYEQWAGKWGPLVLVGLFVIPGASMFVLGPIYLAVNSVVYAAAGFLTGGR